MRKTIKKICLLLCFCLILIPKGVAQQYTIIHQKDEISFAKETDYDVISLQGCLFSTETGKPMLPVQALKYVIPLDKDVVGIKIIQTEETDIVGNYLIMPVQPLMPVQKQTSSLPIIKDSLFYQTNAFYPQEPFFDVETGFMTGTRICSFNFSPVKYNPLTQKIKLITKIVFELEYKTDNKDFCFSSVLSESSRKMMRENIMSMVNNPADFASRSALSEINTNPKAMRGGSEISGIDYVIITADSLSSGFQEIADWKQKKGLRSKVVTTEWIYENFSGIDGAEKVRTFIKYAFQNWGSLWFLIGGDPVIVPVRKAWIGQFRTDIPALPLSGVFIPTDMYYACLEGNWNADGDATFGEGSYNRNNDGSPPINIGTNANIDDVDRYYDVFVGRIPIKTIQELNNYKIKYFNYVKNPTNSVTNAFLFSRNSDKVFSSQMDYVKNSFPSNISVDRCYECIGAYTSFCGTKSDVLGALNGTNKKYHIVCGYGHGAVSNFNTCPESITKDEISMLQNNDNTGMILYNNHCETLTWDMDCVGKRFMIGANGGIAYIGNTHLGWTGDPYRYNRPFISNLYNNKDNIGKSFFGAKGSGTPEDSESRWTFFALNLAAEPEMQVWTNTPQNLQVTPSTQGLVTGENTITVTIGNLPLGREAVICLQKDDEVYEVKLSENGSATFTVTPHTTGTMDITVTAPNFIPYETTIPVGAGQHSLYVSGITIEDDAPNGNGNGKMDAGETIALGIKLKNSGLATAPNVSATLSCSSPDIVINPVPSQVSFGIIAPGVESGSVTKFEFTIDEDAGEVLKDNANPVRFFLTITDGNGITYTDNFTVDLFAYNIEPGNKTILSHIGNMVTFDIDLQNIGNGDASDLEAVLSSSFVSVSCDATPRTYPTIKKGEIKTSNLPFSFQTSSPYDGVMFTLKVRNTTFGKEDTFTFNFTKPNPVSNIRPLAGINYVDLYWDVVPGVKGYNVYRSGVNVSGNPIGYVKVNTFLLPSTFIKDDGLAEVTKYTYVVTSVSDFGNESVWSASVPVMTTMGPKAGFPVKMDATGDMIGSVIAADVTGNGKKEIFATMKPGTPPGLIVALKHDGPELFNIYNNPTNKSGFAEVPAPVWTPAGIGDLRGDGEFQVIIGTRNDDRINNRVICYETTDKDGDYQPDPLFQRQDPISLLSGAVIANLDNSPDGSKEIVLRPEGWTLAERDKIRVWDNNGNELYRFGYPDDESWGSGVAVADLDGDGDMEIIYGTVSSQITNGICIWHHNGTPYGQNPMVFERPNHKFYSFPIVCDLNNNGEKVIVFTATNVSMVTTVYAGKPNGNILDILPGWEDNANNPQGRKYSINNNQHNVPVGIAVGDIDGDGYLEVVALGANVIKIWDRFGNPVNPVNTISATGADGISYTPILADIDGDNDAEIIYASNVNPKGIYAYKLNGTMVPGFPLSLDNDAYVASTPCVADLDGDGKNEIIAATGGKIYVWETKGNSNRIEWGSSRHDPQNTGEYRKDCETTFITANTDWNTARNQCGDIIVQSGTLTLNSAAVVTMSNRSMIIVKDGGSLVVDGGSILNTNIKALPGSSVVIKGNGYVKLAKKGEFNIAKGALFDYIFGNIDITPQ